MSEEDKTWIDGLVRADESVLTSLYNDSYASCLQWVNRHFSVDKTLFEDIYQESMVVLWEAAGDGKLDKLSCSLKTYLFAICRNKLLSHFKLQKRQDAEVEAVEIYQREWMEPAEETDERVSHVQKALLELKEPCRSIITLDYYYGMNNEEIARKLNYESKEVLKVQKSRCMGYLRKKLWNR